METEDTSTKKQILCTLILEAGDSLISSAGNEILFLKVQSIDEEGETLCTWLPGSTTNAS